MGIREKYSASFLPRGFVVMLALLFLAVLVSCQPGGGAPGKQEAAHLQAVRTVAARTMSMSETLAYVGTVRSEREVKVLARVMGTLSALRFEEGARVRKGQVLAQIAVPDLDLRMQRLAADLRRLQNDQQYLCDTLETDLKLRKSGAVPQARVDASGRGCRGAREAVKAARAASGELSSNRGRATERAPFDGRVLRWLAEPGEHVAPGRPMLHLGNHRLEVVVQVNETDLARGIKVGTPVTVALGGPLTGASGQQQAARVHRVAPTTTGPGRTFEVRIPLPGALQKTARHGTSLDVTFVLVREEGAVAVPEVALSSGVAGATIFVIKDGQARAVAVTPGITAAGWVAVKPPLAQGARVAVTNLDVLRDGMKVYAVQDRGGVK